MFGFAPKLPIGDEERVWLNEGFRRLERLLGRQRMLQARVVLPTPEDFPDPYDQSSMAAEKLFERVCSYMGVDRNRIKLEIFKDETEDLQEILPHWHGGSHGCAGFYTHEATGTHDESRQKPMFIAVRSTKLRDPLSLVATIAHELGHAILLGGGLISPTTPDQEPLTDLLTVFLGMGIFTANSANRFRQHQDERRIGWSVQRLGYLPEEAFGYALARFAVERVETHAAWRKFLSTNVKAAFNSSVKWLIKNDWQTKTAVSSG